MNLFSVAGKLAAADQPPVTLDAARCIHVKDKLATCELCVRACPTNAISLNKFVALDEKACVACGLCVRVCPVSAFAGNDGTTDLFNSVARLNAQVIELVCPRHPQPEQGAHENATVIRANTCLASLGSSAYLRLLSQVLSVAIRLDACAECSIGRVQSEIANAFEMASKLFPARASIITEKPGTSAKTRTVYEAKAPPVSRRDFFRVLTGESVRTAVRAFANESDETPVGSALPRERVRLVNTLRQLAPADQTMPANFSGAMRLSADEKCNACGVCPRACPTGALHFSSKDNTTYALTCLVAKCTDCGACLDVCEPQALHREGTPTLAEFIASEPMTLRAGTLKQCAKCNAWFAEHIEGNLCPICDFRRRNPFGSMTPRAFRERQA